MNPLRKAVVGVALAGATLTGGALGAAFVNSSAVAQSDPSTTVPAQTTPAPDSGRPARDPALGGHVGANGIKEELLTGDTADKVKAAALAANPGATIERVENDAEGSPYEAHVVLADGSHATVKVDAGFNVTGTETGHGPK